jgi:hypothetical protein
MDRFRKQRLKMVDTQIRARGIRDERVLACMENMPRHLFVDGGLAEQAYNDNPLPIGERQTISQPYMVALMTEALALTGREKILEIGNGLRQSDGHPVGPGGPGLLHRAFRPPSQVGEEDPGQPELLQCRHPCRRRHLRLAGGIPF